MNEKTTVPHPTEAIHKPDAMSVVSLVEEATAFLQSREDYCERVVSNIIGTWRQFRKHCESKGYELYLPECKESYIQNLSTHTPPFKQETIKRKENNLKMLDLYLKDGTWEKGYLFSKPELTSEFTDFMSSQEAFLKKRHYSENSIETIRKQTYNILLFFQNAGIQKLDDICVSSISTYVLSLKGHARSTMRCEISRLRQILHNAYLLEFSKEDLSVYTPTYNLGQSQSKVKIWRSDEINKVLKTVDCSNPKGLRDAAFITIASELGMRSKDIVDLKLDDLDWESCSIYFNQSKTGIANPLPINEKTGQAIINYLRVRPETDSEYLFVSCNPPYGKMKSFGSAFNRYVNRAGIYIPTDAHHNLHSLRATAATRLLEANVSPDVIVSFLGHSDRETLHHYIRLDIEHLRECALSFEDGEFV